MERRRDSNNEERTRKTKSVRDKKRVSGGTGLISGDVFRNSPFMSGLQMSRSAPPPEMTINSFFESKPVTRCLTDALPATHGLIGPSAMSSGPYVAPHLQSSFVSSTPLSVETTYVPLEDAPEYVNKRHCFLSSHSVPQIVSSLSQEFSDVGLNSKHCVVDYDVELSKNRLSGKVFNASSCRGCVFRVFFFKKNGKVLLEFQRLSGCHIVFSDLYQNVVNNMKASGICESTLVPNRKVRRIFAPLPSPLDPPCMPGQDENEEQVTKCLDQASAKCLLSMALSGHDDAMKDSIAVLACLSRCEGNARTILSCGTQWHHLVSGLLSKRTMDPLFLPCAAKFISNIAALPESRDQLVEFHLSPVTEALQSNVVTSVCRRELIRVVKNLASSHGRRVNELMGYGKVKQILSDQVVLTNDVESHSLASEAMYILGSV